MATKYLHRNKFRSKNIFLSLTGCIPYTGIGCQSYSFLPETSDLESVIDVLIIVFRHLDVIVGGNGGGNAYYGLDFLLNYLQINSSSLRISSLPSDDSSKDASFPELLAAEFIEKNGLHNVLSLLFSAVQVPKMQLKCLTVLIRLCCLDKRAAVILGEFQEVLNFCFHCLTNESLYSKAIDLIELILMCQNVTLNLSSIPHLKYILHKLDGVQLAGFCKVLAVTVSDLDIYENKSSLFAQNAQKCSNDFVLIRDVNQELMLSIPDLLPKLITLGTKLPYTPRYVSLSSEIDHWIRLIDDKISDELGETAMSSGEPNNSELSNTSIGSELSDRVEALYVLSLLLVGQHRKQVQRNLSELQMIPKLSNLFDNFIWRYNGGRQRTRLPGHNQGCECSPEVALKIQFLRLIHSFCDHNEYKHLLLTPCEFDELKRIYTSESNVQDLNLNDSPISSHLMCTGTVGLLSKIIEVLKEEQINSTFRFWLCRALESYLRGRISYADQVFLLRRGLLQHVTISLINIDLRQKEIIQSSFDLLGELIKFNVDACKQMDAILNTEAKLKNAMVIINEKLVDSNMFIRAMILATDHFMHSAGENAHQFASNSRLLAFFRDFDKHLNYVIRLVRLINVNNLTQENVSCLNTSLVIILLSHRQNRLPQFLRELAVRGPDEITTQSNFMSNLKNLLLFWQEYYLHKEKDCTQLEKSSRIPFQFWKKTVESLVSENKASELSLLHHHHYCHLK